MCREAVWRECVGMFGCMRRVCEGVESVGRMCDMWEDVVCKGVDVCV